MRLIARLLSFVASALFGLVLLELLMRAWLTFGPTPRDSTYLPDDHAGYRLRPDTPAFRRSHPDVYVNDLGFRDVGHARTKPPHIWRVLGLGDSFVYGRVAPADNFLRVAQRRLAAVPSADSSRPEMVMMGVGGYSPENELGVLESIGLGLDPDAVVLCFFVGDDVTAIPLRGQVYQGRLYDTGAFEPWRDLARKSYAYRALEPMIASRVRRPQQEAEARRLPVYLRRPGRRMNGLWREAERYLERFDRTCKGAGVPWVLFVIPEEVQVDPDVRRGLLQTLHLSESDYDFDLPQRRLAGFAAMHHVPVVDPLARLRAENRPDARLYISNDTHWNERGNRLAGELLGDALATIRSGSRPTR